MTDPFRAAAVSAALAAGRRFGLATGSAEVLHERSNVLVRMGPVVARVPATTRLLRPDATAWLERDVALSAYLTERGVRVVSPTADPPAGPHFAEGLPVTLWHWTPHDPDHRHGPDETAASLARVHAALRGYPGELPSRGPVGELLDTVARSGSLLDGFADRIGAETERLAALLPSGPVQPLHGDAHPGNLIETADGPCWLDFEDTWRGPLEWDLAILARQGGSEFLAAYPGEADEAVLATCTQLRSLFAVTWRFLIAQRFPHRLDEARAAAVDYFS
ncbi:aminoglycoside phosphotransferase family protein [Amycolatopsis sp. La24]|uniref:phosphotransferase enzyme family protein n=1 Tax=Amycolatopsis sp. La24 TaxID=3028304 RepID=UPI0023B13227|nr:aminoglycoside phosphotransferase family protein [Amycolatopsis sp. La24]